MTTKVNTFNSINIIQDTTLSGTVVDGGTVTKAFYTCPTGKKAYVKSVKVAYVAFGTGTLSRIFLKSNQLDQSAGATASLAEKLTTPAVLTAGQAIQYGGDAAGNNATINFDITLQELPA